MTTQSVQCAKCGTAIDEPPDMSADARKPCSKCGSTVRQFNAHVTETLHFHDSVSYKAKHPGTEKPYVEGFAGDDLHRKSGK